MGYFQKSTNFTAFTVKVDVSFTATLSPVNTVLGDRNLINLSCGVP